MSSIGTWLKPVKLKDVLPITNGLFEHILDADYVFKCDVTKSQLDYLLLANYAHKSTSPAVDMIHDEEDAREKLTDEQMTTLAYMMLNYYKPKWDKLGEIYDIEYDPIHNYLDEWEDEMDQSVEGSSSQDATHVDTLNTTVTSNHMRTDNLEEETEYGRTNTRTDNLSEDVTYGKTNTRTDNLTEATQYGKTNTETDDLSESTQFGKSDTRTDNLTKSNTGTQGTTGTNNNTDSVWGFNSSNAVNSDSSTGGNSSTRTDNLTETQTGTVTDALSGTDTTTKTGTKTDTLSGSDSTTKTGTVADALSGTDTTLKTGTVADALSGSDVTTNTGTETNAGTDATTGTNRRVIDDDRTSSESTDRDRSGRHFGNIGNLTSQKMLKEEIELWKWNYVQSILEDARDFLTIPMYM